MHIQVRCLKTDAAANMKVQAEIDCVPPSHFKPLKCLLQAEEHQGRCSYVLRYAVITLKDHEALQFCSSLLRLLTEKRR